MHTHLEAARTGGVAVHRHRGEGVDQGRIAEHQRTDGRAAPAGGIERHHVGAGLLDIEQPVGSGRGVVDDHQATDVVHQLGHRPQIDDGAQRGRGRRDRDEPGRFGDQVLPLPRRQLPGLDIELGPFDLGAVPVGRAQPGRDVGLVVETRHDDLVAEPGTRRGRIGQQRQQYGTVGAQHDARGITVDQIGNRLARRVQQRRAAAGQRMRAVSAGDRGPKRRRHRRGNRIGDQHAVLCIEMRPAVAQCRVQTTHPGDVKCHNQPSS